MDTLYVRMRDRSLVQNWAVSVAIGVNSEGYKDALDLCTSANEGAKFGTEGCEAAQAGAIHAVLGVTADIRR